MFKNKLVTVKGVTRKTEDSTIGKHATGNREGGKKVKIGQNLNI